MSNRTEGGLRLRKGIKEADLEKPLVSIITVVYNLLENNRVRYFRKMMESVAGQDYGRDRLEHLIIDGGSADGTLELIEEYDLKGAIDYWLSEPDSGIYCAMNKGIAASSGSIVNFMNSDDFFSLDAVRKSVQAIDDEQADFSYAKARLVDKMDHVKRDVWLSAPEFLYFGMPSCHQSMFVKKRWFQRSGLFDESLRIFADWDFMLRIYLQGAKPAFIDQTLTWFRADGLSDNWYENQVAQSEKSQIISKNYLDNVNLTEEEIRRLEKFLIDPLSLQQDESEIQTIWAKLDQDGRFARDVHQLLVYSILNKNNPDVHGRGRNAGPVNAHSGMLRFLSRLVKGSPFA